MMFSRSMMLMIKSSWLDFGRRKDFFVLLSLLIIFAIGAIVTRFIGVDDPSTSRFLLSCGLGLASSLSAVLVALFASRALPEEFEARTLYPLLAKPVTRAQVLWAKFLGIFSLAIVSLVCFLALAWLPVPKPDEADAFLFTQAILLQIISLGGLCWLSIWLSVRFAPMVCAFLSLGTWFLGRPIANFCGNILANKSASAGATWEHTATLIPDWSSLRFFQMYVEGGSPLDFSAFLALALYGMGYLILFALLAIQSFERKPL